MQQQASKSKQTRILTRGLPDETVHQPPSAMAALGWLGLIAGVAANLWQMYTTIAATYQMFTGSANPPLDFQNVTFDICFFAIWVGLAFVIDTLGDFTFIAARTASADASTSAFLVFLYAVALYALSTLAFVRSWEYLWAASAVKEQWEQAREHRPAQPKW